MSRRQDDGERLDVSWQWHGAQWSSSTQPPKEPHDVPDDARDGFSRVVARLMRWASRQL